MSSDNMETRVSPWSSSPGDGVGYPFELVRLANVLRREGHTGNVRLMLEATDRLGNAYRRPFSVNTDLWAYPKDEGAEED